MNSVREGVRAVASLGVGFIAAPVFVLFAYIASYFLFAFGMLINAIGLADLDLVRDNYLNITNVSTYAFGIIVVVSVRFSRTREEHIEEIDREDDYIVPTLSGAGVFLGYFPLFLAMRSVTGHASDFFVTDVSWQEAIQFGYDQILKGLMFDLFEFFDIDLLEIDYITGFNIETVFTFIARVLTGPLCLYLIFFHIQAMKPAGHLADQ